MIESLLDSVNLILDQTQKNFYAIGVILLVLWTTFFITQLNMRLLLWGIKPRTLKGLRGIPLAPFLHANFNHLFFNCIPLVVLSNFILIGGIPYFLATTIMITLLNGLAVWLFARSLIHIGASGVITGYWGFLVYNIYQSGSVTAIILGLVSIYYFISIFLGVFPGKKGVSWEGHFWGLIAGLITSYLWQQCPQIPLTLELWIFDFM